MSSKSKLIVGLVLLAVGAGLVPTGFFINQYLVDQVYEGVPEALLKIKDDATESLEEQIPGLATPDVLNSLKDEAVAQLPLIINGSGAARVINQTIDGVAFFIGLTAAKDQFFNSPTFQADYGTPQGVSDYYDTLLAFDLNITNLGYTTNAQDYLLYGNGSLPGLITDLELGTGVLGYMELYLNASLGDMLLNSTMQFYYNATWSQLEALAGYINNYLWEVVVKASYSGYGFTIEEFAEMIFYAQWANGSQFVDPIDLSLFKSGVPPGTTGLEAGIPIPTNLTVSTCMNLWDGSNPLSFVNDLGIMAWFNASYQTMIEMAFSISTPQYLLVLGWLGNFVTTLTPILILAETGYTIPMLALFAFYEQWANGTVFGESILPEGFLSRRDPPIYGPPYCEVGLTEGATGLTLTQTMALWDEASDYSLVTVRGINKWYSAKPFNSTAYVALKLYNGVLTDVQMEQILDWLPKFRDDIVNKLAKDDKDLPMEPYDLGMAILIGLGVGGVALAAVGIIFLILSRRF